METPNAWSARDRSREASNDYYQKTPMVGPMNGYNDGDTREYNGKMSALSEQGESSVEGDCSMKGIKSEDSMAGYLEQNNPSYQEPKQK